MVTLKTKQDRTRATGAVVFGAVSVLAVAAFMPAPAPRPAPGWIVTTAPAGQTRVAGMLVPKRVRLIIRYQRTALV